MAAEEDRCMDLRALLEALPNAENKPETLSNIRTALSFLSSNLLKDVAPQLSCDNLFDYLRSNESTEIDVCCDILDKLLSAADVNIVLPAFNSELLLGLSHGSPDVKLLSLKQIHRCVSHTPAQLLQFIDIITGVVNCFTDDSVIIAQKAREICTCLGMTCDGRDLLLRNNRVFPSVQTAMLRGDVIRVRIYEMLISIAVLSPEALQSVHDCGLMTRLLEELQQTGDILLRLNLLELLSSLASSKHGLTYLDQHQVLSYMETNLRNVNEESFGALLLPGIIKFFGSVCHASPQEIPGRFRSVFNILFSSINEGPSGSLTGIAVETIGFVGRNSAGKRGLSGLDGDSMVKCCRQFGKFINEATTELKVKTLETVRYLITVEDAEVTNDISTMTEQWFTSLSSNNDAHVPVKRIVDFCRQPFTEVKLASLRLVRSLSLHAWGQRLLHSEPGFDEYLLDRSSEASKEGLEEKYEIVRTLVASGTAVEVFGSEYVLRLKMYEREGAFYVIRDTFVAMDNA